METNYPWDGKVTMNIDPVKKTKFNLYLRVPGWAEGQTSTGSLYQMPAFHSEGIAIKINGKDIQVPLENGYMVINREWKKGDVIEYTIPMPVTKIAARPEVKQDNERMAIQRGPMVYCIEGADNKDGVWNVVVPSATSFTEEKYSVSGEPVVALQATVPSVFPSSDGTNVETRNRTITAIPYYCWANRGANDMQVWLPLKINDVKINYTTK
jgi:uncharacterized protein